MLMHEFFMSRAIELAAHGQYTARPNPMVGCVIVKDNKIIAEGYHEYYGGHHAEVNALSQAGDQARGAICYVTLEPCCHYGKTPPCSMKVVESGIKMVVIAQRDPFSKVNGQGIEYLQNHGVEVIEGVLSKEAAWLNRAFLKRVQSRRPWVAVKLAMSLDGKIADYKNNSQWISDELARADVQKLRAKSDAIMVGSNTILHDNPYLTVRDFDFMSEKERERFRAPKKIVIDSGLKLAADANVFLGSGEAMIYTLENQEKNDLIKINSVSSDNDKVSLEEVMLDLGRREINQLLVEGGGQLVGALLDKDMIDEFIIYTSGLVLGNYALTGMSTLHPRLLAEQERWHLNSLVQIGNSIKSCWTLEGK